MWWLSSQTIENFFPVEISMQVSATCYTVACSHTQMHRVRATARIVGAQGKHRKWGPYYRLCERVWGMPPGNFAVLKCVLGASEAPFHAYIHYIHIYQLPSSFRSKSMTCRALASGCTGHVTS